MGCILTILTINFLTLVAVDRCNPILTPIRVVAHNPTNKGHMSHLGWSVFPHLPPPSNLLKWEVLIAPLNVDKILICVISNDHSLSHSKLDLMTYHHLKKLVEGDRYLLSGKHCDRLTADSFEIVIYHCLKDPCRDDDFSSSKFIGQQLDSILVGEQQRHFILVLIL